MVTAKHNTLAVQMAMFLSCRGKEVGVDNRMLMQMVIVIVLVNRMKMQRRKKQRRQQ